MSVSIRPINEEDKKRMAPSDRQVIRSSPMTSLNKQNIYDNNVVSDSIFGKADHSSDPDYKSKVYEDKYTRVGYINLNKRVLNPFLAGRGAPVWKTVLGLRDYEIVNIINARCVLNRETGEIMHLDDTLGNMPFDHEKYIYGADLLEYLLDKTDLKESLERVLITSFVYPHMTRNEQQAFKAGEFNVGTVEEITDEEILSAINGEIEGWMWSKYKLNMDGSDFTPQRREDMDVDMFNNICALDVTELSQFPLISLLTQLVEEGTDVLKSQILDYVFVLPYGYRPTIENRVDALTSQYNKLVNANLELRDILDQRNPQCYAVLNKYREIVQLIRNIFIGDDAVIEAHRLRDFKSISDTITGKEGLMRQRMQGARVDFSGRAVIVCDPEMPIDCIGVPKSMLHKIAEPGVIKGLRKYKPDNAQNVGFGNRNLTTFSQTSSVEKDGISYDDYLVEWFKEKDRYGIPGRQPTLFYLGMQAFKIIPVDGDAIVLSPLIVMPFNADFDGDQMHFNMAITSRAVKEVRERMASTNNIRYPKNGAITVVVRHEILYGLWAANVYSKRKDGTHYSTEQIRSIGESMELPANHGAYRIVYDAVCKQKINIYDTVNINGRDIKAGTAALEYAIFQGHNVKDLTDFKVKDKAITNMLLDVCGSNKQAFMSAINRLVRLGFAVAKIYPPNISTIVDKSIEEYVKQKVDDFNQRIIAREEYLNIGIETESQYSAYFNNEWEALKKDVTKYLMTNLDRDNGYITMALSGGKGNESNIMQIFGLKGRVQKNDITAFNSIIAGSYSRQLTGLEHGVTAYGSRKGIADKTLATADHGYLSRKLEHAGSIISITWDDCETDKGLEFSVKDIVPFIDESQVSSKGVEPKSGSSDADIEAFYNDSETQTQLLACADFLAKILVGRYCVNSDGSSQYISNISEARLFIDRYWGRIDRETHTYMPGEGDGIVKMRSPIYCTKPCCRKCYGYDLGDGKSLPDIGRPIGFIAAQAIGEVGTQMTMKNFQKGGVVTEANLTSSFEIIEDYFELHDFSKNRRNKRGVVSYDVLSPVEGYVKVQHLGNGAKRIIVTATDDEEDRKNLIPGTKKIYVHANTKLKDYVKKGDSFQKIEGDLDMHEVLRLRGYDKAAMYLMLKLYSTFGTQDVNAKHFETIVAAMTCAYLLSDAKNGYNHNSLYYGEDSKFRAGSLLTRPEVCYGTFGVTPLVWTLIGLKTLPKYKTDFFESLLMESMDSYVPRAIVMNPNDSMTNPITRVSFGLPIGIGSDMEGR